MVALDVAVVVVVALLAVLVAGLLRSHAEIMRTLHHMGVDMSPAGSDDPAEARIALTPRPTPGRPDATDVIDLAGVTPAGEARTIAVSSVRHDTLIAFLTSGCQSCRSFWDVFRTAVPDVPGGARLVAVTRGVEAEAPGTLAQLAGDRLPVVMSTEAWQHYDVPAAPYFVFVSGPGGRIVGEGTASNWDQVRTLVSTAVADGTTRGRVDDELAKAGILPGDPRLHPTVINDGGAV